MLAGILVLSMVGAVQAQSLVRYGFAGKQDAAGWQAAHDVASLRCSADGLHIAIDGGDPYIHGPAQDYPAGQPLWLNLRLQATRAGMGQVFFFPAQRGAREEDSVRFDVCGDAWQEIRVPLPPLGPGYRLRFDPPGGKGDTAIVDYLAIEVRAQLRAPVWPKPMLPKTGSVALGVRSGELELSHNTDEWGGITLRVAGEPVACGLTRALVGYQLDGEQRWISVADDAAVAVTYHDDTLVAEATFRDADGATWRMRRTFTPAAKPNAIDVLAEVCVSQDRAVTYLPVLVLLPGLGSFGGEKHQALLPGVEYLGPNEPSSSEADIIGPGAQRLVADRLKITIPLMVVQAEQRYVGLAWEPQPQCAALFDSPDRVFKSGAHVMGILFPGSDGSNRSAGSVLPYAGEVLKADAPLTLRATLVGGRGSSVVPAVKQYVALHGWPAIPQAGVAWDSYAATTASGWLDSGICVGDRYRHAYPGNFGPAAAPDAATLMDWLALHMGATDMGRRLAEAAQAAIAAVPPRDRSFAGVSHVRYPVAALVYGDVAENVAGARASGRHLLARFDANGSVPYQKRPDGPDYGRTHFAQEANGLTAESVSRLLQAAVFCGDRELIGEGLRLLTALDKYAGTVPRGAQTWEVPLHTPDILASAHLVRAYTLGYELTGERRYLKAARYWAWTGVPFVYLEPPTDQPVGLYATIAVLGATNWVAPNWMGLPVQWCGLVYADALYGLARHDPGGPWKQLADGITASGVQQTWPRGSDAGRQGLLPDSFALRAQVRNDPAINPGTVQANAIRLFGGPPLYDYHVFRENELVVHVPGAIQEVVEQRGRISFVAAGWPDHSYDVLIVGFESTPRVQIDGVDVALTAPHSFDAQAGVLVLRIDGQVRIRVAR